MRTNNVNMQVHHDAVIKWTKELLDRPLTQAEKDAMPAIPLLITRHTGKNGTGAFHAILRGIPLKDTQTYSKATILDALEGNK